MHVHHACSAEVPAKDLVVDAQAAVKRDPCEVLGRIARVPLSSADMPVYNIFRKHGLVLPIDFSWAKAGNEERYPYINPKTQLEALSDGYFHRVLGVPVDLASEALTLFWEKFRALHPRHGIFEDCADLDFGRLIPYYLHGDGGRGFKKDPIEILSMFPALGSGSRQHPVHLSNKRRAQPEIKLGINLQGASGATRFLFTVLSSLVSKHDDSIFDDLLDIWGKHLKALLNTGFQAAGATWHIAVLGFTGDSPFVKKVGHMNRSFNNVRKTHSSKNAQKGVCWLCHAGFESPADNTFIPFEHLGYMDAAWINTTKLNNPLPWSDGGGALLQYMLVDKADTPAAFFRADFFHVYHAGVGKDFSASAIIYMMKALYGLGGVERDLRAINAALKSWMAQEHTRLHCGFLTQDLLGYNGTREYPEGKWSKNMDTAVVMKFIVYLLQIPEFQAKVRDDEVLQAILTTALAMAEAVKTCFQAEYFMSTEHCQIIIDSGHKFLCGYAGLVSKCFTRKPCLFKLRPKIHYLNHIFLRVFEEWSATGTAVNPCAESTFMSEDFVGKTSRISRRVSTRAVATKTLQRYMLFLTTSLSKDSFEMLDLSMLD